MTQRKSTHTTRQAARKIELAPNQVYVKDPASPVRIQTLVEGYDHWSYYQYTWAPEIVSLNYKGHFVIQLIREDDGRFWNEHSHGEKEEAIAIYTSLREVIEYYHLSHRSYLEVLDQMNKRAGLEMWCIRQSLTTAPLNLHLTLPKEERKRIERVAKAAFDTSLEEFVLHALYAYLPGLENRYKDRLTVCNEKRQEE